MKASHSIDQLKKHAPEKEYFVGIDSDGCVFDAMEIKHKECFCPNTVRVWGLQSVSKYARETVEFVNLYSKWRGVNRWKALIEVFDLLGERPEVIRRGVELPQGNDIRAFIASGLPLSNPGLQTYMKDHSSHELELALEWSTAVNRTIEEIVYGMIPFPLVKESLEALSPFADAYCVSSTPEETLEREWTTGGVKPYVRMICGQECGSKENILKIAAEGKYVPEKTLMMGDAPGDLKAAKSINALFFPINPGFEEASWEEFYNVGYHRFLEGTYKGAYEEGLIEHFEQLLPEVPPWKKQH